MIQSVASNPPAKEERQEHSVGFDTYILLTAICFVNNKMKNIFRVKGVFRLVQQIAVIGHPIGHTMSPFIHERLFQIEKIPFSYRVMDVPSLPDALDNLRQLNGFNITIPYKKEIIPFLDEIDPQAKAFGSVNTVWVDKGRLKGFTTDGEGCYKALQSGGCDFSGKVLLLGNGGAARAIAFEAAARAEKLNLTIVSRPSSLHKGEELKDALQTYILQLEGKGVPEIKVCTYDEIEERTDEEFDVLLNATSVGMYPHIDVSPVSQNVVKRCGCVFDAIYNPQKTKLLQYAESAGVQVIGGMEMLVWQAAAAHRIWYGSDFLREDILQICQDAQVELERKFSCK
jgi:shikimate dehydrogenase